MWEQISSRTSRSKERWSNNACLVVWKPEHAAHQFCCSLQHQKKYEITNRVTKGILGKYDARKEVKKLMKEWERGQSQFRE